MERCVLLLWFLVGYIRIWEKFWILWGNLLIEWVSWKKLNQLFVEKEVKSYLWKWLMKNKRCIGTKRKVWGACRKVQELTKHY